MKVLSRLLSAARHPLTVRLMRAGYAALDRLPYRHIICLDRTTTGDGMVSALQVLAVMKNTGRSLAELASGMRKFPQVLLNVKVAARFDPAEVPAVREAVQRIEKRMNGQGRVVLRPSGTEPVIRVMVEGRDESATRAAATELAEVVRAAAG